jgi:extradiol dioxygenase family protein
MSTLPDTRMSNLRPKPSVVVFVRDVRRLSQFYRDVATMSVIHEAEDHVVLELAGFQLVIHALRGEPEPSHHGAGQVVAREDAYVKVCLPVTSLARARARAAELGGLLAEPGQEWEARGFRACDGHDPEGNVLQLREPAA